MTLGLPMIAPPLSYEEMREVSELAMLRDFYTKWTRVHTIPHDRLHRHKQEAAAQDLVDAAHTLSNFYKTIQ